MSGREWRLERGGGSRTAAQQYQPPSTEKASRHSAEDGAFFPLGLLSPSCQVSQETFSLHHFITGWAAGIFPMCAWTRSAWRQSARIISYPAPDASGALCLLCTAAPWARPPLATSDTHCLSPPAREPELRQPGKEVVLQSRWMWSVAGEQAQTGGAGKGERRRDSRGWEPTSPWSKDRPPVCPKNTCEFFKQGVGRKTTLLLGCCVQFFIYSWLPGGLLCSINTLYRCQMN